MDLKKLTELNSTEKLFREEKRAAATSIWESLPGLDSDHDARTEDSKHWWNELYGKILTQLAIMPLHPLPPPPLSLTEKETVSKFLVTKEKSPCLSHFPNDWIPRLFGIEASSEVNLHETLAKASSLNTDTIKS